MVAEFAASQKLQGWEIREMGGKSCEQLFLVVQRKNLFRLFYFVFDYYLDKKTLRYILFIL